jgi:hypothetical protein
MSLIDHLFEIMDVLDNRNKAVAFAGPLKPNINWNAAD